MIIFFKFNYGDGDAAIKFYYEFSDNKILKLEI